MRISDWSSDVCSSDLAGAERLREQRRRAATVVAERQCLRAAPPGQTAEGAPEGIGVPLRDRRPDGAAQVVLAQYRGIRSEEHTSELQSLMRISYAVFCLKKKKQSHTAPDDDIN